MSYKSGLGVADDLYGDSTLNHNRRHRRSHSFSYTDPRRTSDNYPYRTSRDYYRTKPSITERVSDALLPSSTKYGRHGRYGYGTDRYGRSSSVLGDRYGRSSYDRNRGYYDNDYYRKYGYTDHYGNRHYRRRSGGLYDNDYYGRYDNYNNNNYNKYGYNYGDGVVGRHNDYYDRKHSTIRPYASKYYNPKRVEIEGYSSDSSSSSSSSSGSDRDVRRRRSGRYYTNGVYRRRRITGRNRYDNYDHDDLTRDTKGKLRLSAYPYFGTVGDVNRVQTYPYYGNDHYRTKHMRSSSDGPWSITTVQHIYKKPPAALIERPGYYEKTYYEKPGGAYYEKGDGYYERPGGKYYQKDEYYENKRIGY